MVRHARIGRRSGCSLYSPLAVGDDDCGSDEAVSAATSGGDEARILRVVRQGLAQLVDGSVQAGVEVDEGVRRPEALAKLVARNHFSGPLQEDGEHGEGALLQPDDDAIPAQFASAEVDFIETEADSLR